jgi:hypothetical protein
MTRLAIEERVKFVTGSERERLKQISQDLPGMESKSKSLSKREYVPHALSLDKELRA